MAQSNKKETIDRNKVNEPSQTPRGYDRVNEKEYHSRGTEDIVKFNQKD